MEKLGFENRPSRENDDASLFRELSTFSLLEGKDQSRGGMSHKWASVVSRSLWAYSKMGWPIYNLILELIQIFIRHVAHPRPTQRLPNAAVNGRPPNGRQEFHI